MGDVTAITPSLVILCTGKDLSKTRRSKNTDTATIKDRFFACPGIVGAILVIVPLVSGDHKDRPYGCCLSMAPWPPDGSGAGSDRVGVSEWQNGVVLNIFRRSGDFLDAYAPSRR